MQVISGVKPREKKKFITELQNDQNIVAMVGDGINDAAALASSHVGIAMGGGVGAASEASSIVLLGNRLSQVIINNLTLVVNSKHLFAIRKRTLFFSIRLRFFFPSDDEPFTSYINKK